MAVRIMVGVVNWQKSRGGKLLNDKLHQPFGETQRKKEGKRKPLLCSKSERGNMQLMYFSTGSGILNLKEQNVTSMLGVSLIQNNWKFTSIV